MNPFLLTPCTAFDGFRRFAHGPLHEVAVAIKNAVGNTTGNRGSGPVTIYDDATGRVIDLDTRGSAEEVVERLAQRAASAPPPALAEVEESAGQPRGRGRPKLGVVAREVTLLPRHWDWLGTQPSGASVALRKLVDEARRTSGDKDRVRAAQEAAYRFMSAMAGNLPGFEEAARALFAYDRNRFGDLIAAWPEDVRDHAMRLALAHLGAR